MGKETVSIKIRRFDLSEKPDSIDKSICITVPNTDYSTVTEALFEVCGVSPEKTVLKIRNSDEMLVPVSFLIENPMQIYYIDVANISCKNTNSLLQDAYVDAVCNKVKSLESRIAQAELLLPQLEWRRQAYMEDTVSGLLNKVQFLNRRFDELYPKYKINQVVPN
ncbi:hypothetical protein GWI33_018670 [Rhynchophorus ferrugineus]|uniref:Uncharacterized protein n=1 Tax=Rhynchophorus ferrugineus TaxID=354439 RepID=A0A834M1A0_RHYFE|nr:hypothetical protein GWI33_018670 [Rhynchophorus ferrugineus]